MTTSPQVWLHDNQSLTRIAMSYPSPRQWCSPWLWSFRHRLPSTSLSHDSLSLQEWNTSLLWIQPVYCVVLVLLKSDLIPILWITKLMWSSYQFNFSKLSGVNLIMIQLQVTIWVNQSTSQPVHQSTSQPVNPSPLSYGYLTIQSPLPQPELDVNFITCETSPWRGRDEQWRYLTVIICVILDSSSSIWFSLES